MASTPTRIEKIESGSILIQWSDGHERIMTPRQLRKECACAGCVSEHTGERLLEPESIPEGIAISGAEHVGRYGVKFHFSDGHRDGIYTWENLRTICEGEECTCDSHDA